MAKRPTRGKAKRRVRASWPDEQGRRRRRDDQAGVYLRGTPATAFPGRRGRRDDRGVFTLPREGSGDYRKPTPHMQGGKEDGSGVGKYLSADHVETTGHIEFRSVRNNLPPPLQAKWGERRSGWAARIAERNLANAILEYGLPPEDDPDGPRKR